MGNYLALCTVGDNIESKEAELLLLKQKRVLQIIKVDDGKILEFTKPVIVRDLLAKHPRFYVGVFNKATQSLPLDYKLKIGNIYYLLPSSSSSSVTHSNNNIITNNEDYEDKRREMDVTTTTKTKTTTTTTTTTTIKVVITKEQLQQILQKQARVEELLMINNNNKVVSSSNGGWFPKLESIPEGNYDVVC